MIRRLWVFLCQAVAACVCGVMAGYLAVHGIRNEDWQLYIAALAVLMTALWQVVLFRE